MLKQSMLFIVLLTVLTAPQTLASGSNPPSKIILATTNWCPYACPNSEELPGIAYEYIQATLKQLDMDVDIKFYPWTRAIKEVESGRAHGLLTAVREEAPDFVFTNTPTMSYRVCFFSNKDSQWRYKGVSSLNTVTLGAIKGYGYDSDIDEYIRNAKSNEAVQLISGGKEIPRFINMLDLNRIDAFLDDQYVAAWEAKTHRIDLADYQNAGCLSENPFFIAFSPKFKWASELVEKLDVQFSKKEHQALLNEIIKKYTNK
ncbi:MAG: transporter substrate-binding domain-containing protein [Bermanella sp.]